MRTTLFTLFIPILLQAQPDPAALNAIFTKAYPADQPGASVLIVKDGTVLLHAGYGLADLAAKTPMKADSPHKIGSITKQFTAVAVLTLVNEGKIDLNKSVEDYFPGLLPYGAQIRVEQLLTHVSGIPSYTNQPDFMTNMGKPEWDAMSVVRLTTQLPAEFAPGERWNYNNTAYVLLGALIEKASGMSYARYMETVIAPKAGLTATRYGVGAIPGYSPGDNGYQPAAHINMDFPHAAGALVSTVSDLYAWTQAVSSGKVIPASLVDAAWTSAVLNDGSSTGYGYGWGVSEWRGKRIISHGGGIPGFVTHAMWLPEEKLFIAVLGNRDGGDPNPEMLAFEAMGLALGMPLYPDAVPLSEAKAKDYAGVYKVDDATRRVITVDGAQVKSQRTGSSVFDIVHIGDDTFYYPGSLSRVTFLRDADGTVTAMRFNPGNGPTVDHPKTDEPLPSGPVEIPIDPTVFDPYVGEYELAPNFILKVWRDANGFWTQATGQGAINIYPESETRFFLKVTPAALQFHKNEQGEVTHLTLFQAGREMPARKLK